MSDYYVVMRANNPHYPLLDWDDDENEGLFYKGTPVDKNLTIRLCFGDPVPRKPQMADYHSLPKPVVSAKIKNILEPMKIQGIQLVPAKVEGLKEKIYDYWLIHVFNQIPCMDREKSVYRVSKSGLMTTVKKLAINEEYISRIPLKKRLIFQLAESVNLHIFHKSIHDAIMAENPEGIRFIDANEWTNGSSFE